MKKKKGVFKNFTRSGYGDFRYGEEGARPVTLAGKKAPKPVLNKGRREHVVSKIMEVLRDWRQSPFENEGPALAALRSALCLEGHGWHRSDQQAAEVVADALRRIGAVRPTWLQGQREYVEPRENCAWCSGPLSTEMMPRGLPNSFCSTKCAKSAILVRDLRTSGESRKAYLAAYRVIAKLSHSAVTCAHCAEKFHPQYGSERFCSAACAAESLRLYPDKQCLHCRKTFQSKSSDTKAGETVFCSRACAYAYGHRHKYRKECTICGVEFEAKTPLAKTCSKRCQHLQNGWMPSKLYPQVFDYIMRAA